MSSDERMGRYTWSERMYVLEAKEMCKRVERICQVDPEGWYAPVVGQELIRCKDCKHWDGVDTCDVIDAPVWDNDFCSMAERRSDE